MENILAVITNWDDAEAVLGEAEKLATQFHTSLEVLVPVHDQLGELSKYLNLQDFSQLQAEIVDAESAHLDKLCAGKNYRLHVEWTTKVHTTVVEKAQSYGAGLIVMMASHDPALALLVHTPDDWHLFRDTPCPVLAMVKDRQACQQVIAAIDALDNHEAHQQLSARVLDNAAALAKAEGVPLKVLSVVPDPALVYAGIVNAPMSGDFLVDTMAIAEKKTQALVEHLGISPQTIEVVTGRVEEVVSQTALQAHALLVIGNAANKGLKGLLMGNTAERILRGMKTDMLVVN
ncbi:MAG: universal stress protein [Gammaproteobacteria bacterium]|nr:universal stress protein [Gammaproteobacteria bacterium]MBQ0840626.1 universal stress protein [Gammaproteobacteria bacterium]